MTLEMLLIATLKLWWVWPVPIGIIIGIFYEVRHDTKKKRVRYGTSR